jgi:hypothetical protein
MRKLTTLLLLLITVLLFATSCSQGDGAPEGLELIIESDEGFVLYGPEGWINITAGYSKDKTIYGSKLSNTSKTSMTFIEAEMPTVGYNEYYTKSLTDFPEAYAVTSIKSPEKASFGNAAEAYRSIFTFKHEAYSYESGEDELTDFTTLQFYIKNGGRFYIFTYTAKGGADDEMGDYLKYLDLIYKSVDSFKFTSPSNSSNAPELEEDTDGFILVSDKLLSGFECYVPKDFSVINSSGSLDVSISRGAAFSLSKISSAGAKGFVDYFDTRISELSTVVTEINVISRELTNLGENSASKKIVLGDLGESAVMAFEYTYKFEGKSYHVYQVMGMNSMNAFVFTYTALEGEYTSHLDAIDTVLSKIKF